MIFGDLGQDYFFSFGTQIFCPKNGQRIRLVPFFCSFLPFSFSALFNWPVHDFVWRTNFKLAAYTDKVRKSVKIWREIQNLVAKFKAYASKWGSKLSPAAKHVSFVALFSIHQHRLHSQPWRCIIHVTPSAGSAQVSGMFTLSTRVYMNVRCYAARMNDCRKRLGRAAANVWKNEKRTRYFSIALI